MLSLIFPLALLALIAAAIFAPLALFNAIIILVCLAAFIAFTFFIFVKALFKPTKPSRPIRDPVHRDDETGQWFFWEENLTHRQGPFENEAAARFALKSYVKNVLEAL